MKVLTENSTINIAHLLGHLPYSAKESIMRQSYLEVRRSYRVKIITGIIAEAVLSATVVYSKFTSGWFGVCKYTYVNRAQWYAVRSLGISLPKFQNSKNLRWSVLQSNDAASEENESSFQEYFLIIFSQNSFNTGAYPKNQW